MNIYVETNFVLELVFQQEQSASCEGIVNACESGRPQLVVPAYCLAEPHEKMRRQTIKRKELQRSLDAELNQLARSVAYKTRIKNIQDLSTLLIQSNEEENQRFERNRERLLRICEVIPLTAQILIAAAGYESMYDLTPQDAIVYASVIQHLQQSGELENCFLNKNTKDFDNPDIVEDLDRNHCKMLPRFDQGYDFIRKQMQHLGL